MNKHWIVVTFVVAFACICTDIKGQFFFIDKLKDTTITKFNTNEGGRLTEIDEESIKNTFQVHIKGTFKTQKVLMKGENNEYVEEAVIQSLPGASTTIYEVNDIQEHAGFAYLKVFAKTIAGKDTTIDITLKIAKSASITDPVKCKLPLVGTVANDSSCSPKETVTDTFNTTSKNFPGNKVLYVYDFGGENAGKIFKIWRKHNFLKKQDVNLSIQEIDLSNERLNPRQFVQLKVVNINKFMYDVAVTDSIVSFDSEPSALFNQFFIGDDNLLGKLMSNFATGITTLKSSANNKSGIKSGDLIEQIKCFIYKYNSLHARRLQAYSPCSQFPCCGSSTGADYAEIANDLLNVKLSMAVIFQNEVAAKTKELKKQNEGLKICEKNAADLELNGKQQKLIEAIEAAARSKPQKDSLAELKKNEIELLKKKCTDDKVTAFKSDIASLEAEIKTYAAINDFQSKLPDEEELRRLIVFINNMVASNNSYVSAPISVSGNQLEIKINIKSKDSIVKYYTAANSFDNTKKAPYVIPVLWKSFVSFSAGTFIAIHERLKNKLYDWQQVANNNNMVLDTAKFRLVESSYTQPPMGFAALANIEWKASRAFGFGLSAGVGLTIEREPRIAYLGGGSLFFGEQKQLALTGGFAGMQIERLKTNFEAIASQQIIYASKQTIEYYKEFKVGGFIALTYTPFKTSKR